MSDARPAPGLGDVDPAQIIEALTPYVTERRRARIARVVESRLCGVEVALERPYDPHNAAAVVRSAHPDKPGGSQEGMLKVSACRTLLRMHCGLDGDEEI